MRRQARIKPVSPQARSPLDKKLRACGLATEFFYKGRSFCRCPCMKLEGLKLPTRLYEASGDEDYGAAIECTLKAKLPKTIGNYTPKK